jgi:hypothetical protein
MHRFHEVVMEAFRKKVLFTRHALDRMNAPERMIKKDEVYDAIENGEVVEDYPNDPRGHSCLIEGKVAGRTIRVVCAPKDKYLAVITVYIRQTGSRK